MVFLGWYKVDWNISRIIKHQMFDIVYGKLNLKKNDFEQLNTSQVDLMELDTH